MNQNSVCSMEESGFSWIIKILFVPRKNQNSDCSMNKFQDSVCSMDVSKFCLFHGWIRIFMHIKILIVLWMNFRILFVPCTNKDSTSSLDPNYYVCSLDQREFRLFHGQLLFLFHEQIRTLLVPWMNQDSVCSMDKSELCLL